VGAGDIRARRSHPGACDDVQRNAFAGQVQHKGPRVDLLLAYLSFLQISTQLIIEIASNAANLYFLLHSLTEHFTPSVLKTLGVRVACPVDFDNNDFIPLMTPAFRKLQNFAGLTSLNLNSIYISIADDEFLELVSAWPQMGHLYP